MSKYWKNMNILRKKTNNNLFISKEHPNFAINIKYNLQHDDFSDYDIKEISNFYNNNYMINGNTNIIQVSINDLKRYLNFFSKIVIIKESSKLIGSMISFYIPIKINKNKDSEIFEDSIFGYSSFLVLNYKYKRKGLGMTLIQKSLNLLHDSGHLGAYFVNNSSRCINSIPLAIWNVKLKNLENLVFDIQKIDENYKNSCDFYNFCCRNKKFYFYPSYEYWEKWIKTFPTYTINENNKIIGIFSFESKLIYCSEKREYIYTGHLIICVGEQPKTLLSSLFTAKNIFDDLVIYEMGDLNKKLISSINGLQIGKKFINFYNTSIFLRIEDIYIPIF